MQPSVQPSIFEIILLRPDLLLWAFLGAFVLYALNRLQDHQPFSIFKVINVETGRDAKPSTILFDMVISSAVGALVIFAFTAPETGRQAIAAGLGMTGLLSAAIKGK